MSEFLKIAITAFSTVFGGVGVLVFGQIAIKFVIEPIQEQRKLLAEIAHALVFYANAGPEILQLMGRDLDRMDDSEEESRVRRLELERREELIREVWKRVDAAAELFRQQASQLLARTYAIPSYSFWVRQGVVRPLEDIRTASSNLIGMSNTIRAGFGRRFDDQERYKREIVRCLGLSELLPG